MRAYKSNVTSFTTYQHSDAYKKSRFGFDERLFQGWNECWDKHVIPMAIKNEKLQQELLIVKVELNKLKGKV